MINKPALSFLAYFHDIDHFGVTILFNKELFDIKIINSCHGNYFTDI